MGTFFGRSGRPRDAFNARYLPRLPPAPHDCADWTGPRSHIVSEDPSRPEANRVRRSYEHSTQQVSRYRRPTLLVNLIRSSHRAGKVEQMSRALALVALMHLSSMPSEHPFMLDVASSPLTKLPCSPPRTIQAFGRLARKGGCKSSSASGSVGSTSAHSRPLASCLLWAWAAAERMLRQRNLDFLAPPCKRCWRRLAAQL